MNVVFLELYIAFMIIKRKVEDNFIAYCILAFLVEDEGHILFRPNDVERMAEMIEEQMD